MLILNFPHFTMIKQILGFCFQHTITLSISPQKVDKIVGGKREKSNKICQHEVTQLVNTKLIMLEFARHLG